MSSREEDSLGINDIEEDLGDEHLKRLAALLLGKETPSCEQLLALHHECIRCFSRHPMKDSESLSSRAKKSADLNGNRTPKGAETSKDEAKRLSRMALATTGKARLSGSKPAASSGRTFKIVQGKLAP